MALIAGLRFFAGKWRRKERAEVSRARAECFGAFTFNLRNDLYNTVQTIMDAVMCPLLGIFIFSMWYLSCVLFDDQCARNLNFRENKWPKFGNAL